MVPPYIPRPGTLEGLEGRYDSDGRIIVVTRAGTQWTAEFSPDDRRELVPIGDDVFADSILGSRVTFRRNALGEPIELVWEWPRCTMSAVKVMDGK
jgi:hypothetical protein